MHPWLLRHFFFSNRKYYKSACSLSWNISATKMDDISNHDCCEETLLSTQLQMIKKMHFYWLRDPNHIQVIRISKILWSALSFISYKSFLIKNWIMFQQKWLWPKVFLKHLHQPWKEEKWHVRGIKGQFLTCFMQNKLLLHADWLRRVSVAKQLSRGGWSSLTGSC